MPKHRLVVVVALVAVFVSVAAVAQDWPQWRGPDRDGKAAGFTAPETWPAALTQQWRVSVGAGEGPDYASPVVMTVADMPQVVTLTEKSVVGVSLLNARLLWQVPFVPQGRAYNSSTPVVAGQTVYVTGSLRGIRALKIGAEGGDFTATELWANPDLSCQYSTPVLHEGFLYGVSDRGYLFCLNAQTGQPAWVDATVTDKGSYGPMVDAGAVLMALPSTGELIIFKPDSTAFAQLARYRVADTAVYAYPVVSGKRIIVKDQDNVTCWVLP